MTRNPVSRVTKALGGEAFNPRMAEQSATVGERSRVFRGGGFNPVCKAVSSKTTFRRWGEKSPGEEPSREIEGIVLRTLPFMGFALSAKTQAPREKNSDAGSSRKVEINIRDWGRRYNSRARRDLLSPVYSEPPVIFLRQNPTRRDPKAL